MVAALGLQLNDQGRLSGEDLQHLRKRRDGLGGALQRVVGQVGGGQLLHFALFAGGALELGVMDDSKTAVFQQMYIQLRTVPVLHSCPEGRQRIFRDTITVKSPVGVVPAPELFQTLMAGSALQRQQISGTDGRDRP